MKRPKICGIYKITTPTKSIYIGQSKDCYYRRSKYIGGDCKKQQRLYNSIQKYGWDAHKFEIIHMCTPEELNVLEKYYVDLYGTFNSDHGLNLRDGGGATGSPSEETKKKNSVSLKEAYVNGRKQKPIGEKNGMYGNGNKLKGEKNGRYGMPVSDETKKRLSDGNKKAWEKIRAKGGRHITEDQKQKISKANKGHSRNLGSKRSEETKLKMSKSSLGRKFSDEAKEKMGIKKRKILINTQTGIFYYGVKDAANSMGVHVMTLYHKLHGYYKNNTNFIYA